MNKNTDEIIKNCKELISNNHLSEAFDNLIDFTELNGLKTENDILLLRNAELISIENEVLKGTIDFKQSKVLFSNITNVLFNVIKRIEAKNLPEKIRKVELTESEQIHNKLIQEEIINVFISYSWDDETHKKWVLELAEQLMRDGINVILDRWELRLGKSLPHFIENSIKNSNRIIIIFTPNYKLKAERRAGGVGYEYSIMNSTLYKDQINNNKIIPILRKGKSDNSIPEFMQQYIHINMRNDKDFNNTYTDLLREIYNKPETVKPNIGNKRKFD